MLIGRMDKHIDNGGITVSVYTPEDDLACNYSIEFETSYFGYPEVSSAIRAWGHLGPDFLRQLGTMFIESAGKLDEIYAKEDL